MLWETELRTLAGRKQGLVAESDQLRFELQRRLERLAFQWRWVDRVQRVLGLVRPALMLGASFLGFRRTAKRGRLLQIAGAGYAVMQGGRRLLRRCWR
jgi:hypothetical protein